MSETHENNEERFEEAEPAPAAPAPGPPGAPEASAPGAGKRAGEGERPLKVVDRRFWARRGAGEEAAEAAAPSTHPTVVQELESRLRDTQARLREALVEMQRARLENDEFRERLQRDLERKVTLAKAALFRDLLEVADNLERALAAAAGSAATGDLVRGVDQVLGQMRRLLASEGVEEVEVAGLPFDPEVAEAIEVREGGDAGSDGRVLEVAQRGYRYAGRTLRPARVVVARAPARPPSPPETPGSGSS